MSSLRFSVCLLVTDIDAETGGVQRNSRLLLREFGRRGITVFACTRNYYRLPRKSVIDGAVVHRAPVVGRTMAINGMIYLATTFFWLLRNRKKYDVIHCQQLFGPTMTAALASFFIRKPIVTRITLSGATGEAATVPHMRLAWVRLRLLRRISLWIALTAEMKRELEQLGIPADRIRIIHNATDIPPASYLDKAAQTQARQELHLAFDKVGVFVGRLSEEKNIDVLIRAWNVVAKTRPDAHLLLLGAGGDYRNVEESLRMLASELSLADKVHFLGHRDDVTKYLLASDIFILPTIAEGMSNALVEAFAWGRPIVATDIEANREICEHNVNSILVPVRSVEALADAILRILGSRELSLEIATNARKKAENELSINGMIDAYIESYQELIGSNGKD